MYICCLSTPPNSRLFWHLIKHNPDPTYLVSPFPSLFDPSYLYHWAFATLLNSYLTALFFPVRTWVYCDYFTLFVIYIHYPQLLKPCNFFFLSYICPLSLYVATSEYWAKVVVKLLVEGGEHSSAAVLVHNHRADSGEKQRPRSAFALSFRPLCAFFPSSFYFPQALSTFLEHCPHFYYFSYAVGPFSVFMVMPERHFPIKYIIVELLL